MKCLGSVNTWRIDFIEEIFANNLSTNVLEAKCLIVDRGNYRPIVVADHDVAFRLAICAWPKNNRTHRFFFIS